MKNILFIIAVTFFAFSSCTKTKTIYIDKPIHDTTSLHDTSYYRASLIGNWQCLTNTTWSVSFSTDSAYWSNGFDYKYAASYDTIYTVSSNKNISPLYSYRLSLGGDTLILTNPYPNYSAGYYTRAN